ncbi:MAG: pentapeptide repeat-containing protein [Bradymonadia bacterium]
MKQCVWAWLCLSLGLMPALWGCDSSVDADNPCDPESAEAAQARVVVRGRLIAPEGDPQALVEGMAITLTAVGEDDATQTQMADADGAFSFDAVVSGDWLLEAQGGELYLPRVPFSVNACQPADLGLMQTARRPIEGALSGTAQLMSAGEQSHGGILVAVRGGLAQTRTLTDGSFTLQLPHGRHDIEFSYPGYATEVVAGVNVEAATTLDAPVVLNSRPVRMVGRVTLEGLESAERTATTGVLLIRDGVERQVTVGDQGRVAADDLSPGVYTLVASRPGYRSVERSFQGAPGGFEDVGLLVLRHHALTGDAVPFRGRVQSVGAASQAGVEVTVRLAGSELVLGRTITDANGDFTVLASPDESYVFTADRPDYVPFTAREPFAWDAERMAFVDAAGRTPKADLLAEDPRGSVTFDVAVGPEWLPLEARTARVLVQREGEVLPELVGADGQRIRVDNLQPGSYRLVVGRPGFTGAEAEFEVVNAPDGLNVVLDETLSIRLSNLTASGIELGQVVQAEWFEGVEVAGATLSRRTLVGDFGGLDLTGVRLPDSDLTQASFDGALMSEADLSRVVATGSSFVGAELTGALFAGARLEGSRFHCAERLGDGRCGCLEGAEACVTSLMGASFDNALLLGADFSGALLDEGQFTGAIFGLSGEGVALSPPLGCDLPLSCRWDTLEACEEELPEGCRGVPTRFTGASMVRATMPGAVLEHVDFSDADLHQANLNNATITFNTHLRRADLTGAQLRVARLNGADLREATLVEAVLNDADLTGADLSAVDAKRAVLQGADLSRTVLRHTLLQGADLRSIVFAPEAAAGADLAEADMREAVLVSRAEIGPLVLDGARLEGARMEGIFWGWSFRGIQGRGLETQNGTMQLVACDFSDADLTEAVFTLGGQGDRVTAMESTRFDGADLTDASMLTVAGILQPRLGFEQRHRRDSCMPLESQIANRGTLPWIRWTSFSGANLDRFTFSGFDFMGDMSQVASAEDATLNGNYFHRTNFDDSRFDRAHMGFNQWEASSARRASFAGAHFEHSSWMVVDARDAGFQGADMNTFRIHQSMFMGANLNNARWAGTCVSLSSFYNASLRGVGPGVWTSLISTDVVGADFTGARFEFLTNLATEFSEEQLGLIEEMIINIDEGDHRIYNRQDMRESFVPNLGQQALDICATGGSCHEMAASCAPYEDEVHFSCQDMTCQLLLNGGCDNPEAFFGEGLNLDFCDVIPQDPSLLVDTCDMYEGAVFIGANLEGVDAIESDFFQVNFNRANLRGMVFPFDQNSSLQTFIGADLTEARIVPEEGIVGFDAFGRDTHLLVDTVLDGVDLQRLDAGLWYLDPASMEGMVAEHISFVSSFLTGVGLDVLHTNTRLLNTYAVGADLSDHEGPIQLRAHESNLEALNVAGAQLNDNTSISRSNLAALRADGARANRFAAPFSNLDSASLVGAQMPDINIEAASGWDINLADADWSRAYIDRATLGRVSAVGANLSAVDFHRAQITFTSLEGANLTGADLRGLDLSNITMVGAEMMGVQASGALLNGAELNGAELSEGDFDSAMLSGADLSDTVMSGARFDRARLMGVDMSRAVVGDASFTWADLSGADLAGIDLRQATLSHARLADADLTGAQICRSQLASANTGDWSEATIDEGC